VFADRTTMLPLEKLFRKEIEPHRRLGTQAPGAGDTLSANPAPEAHVWFGTGGIEMAKAKLKTTLMVADSAGGLIPVADHRFEAGKWPIQIEVPKERADSWLQYLSAECVRRGWSGRGVTQLERRENSGSHTIQTGPADQPQIDVVWE